MGRQRFEAVLQLLGKTATGIEVPLDVPVVFGSARAPVRGTIDGQAFRGRIAPMGGRYLLGVNREKREAMGLAAGQTVTVELERDDEERVVEVPDDLAAALGSDPVARAAFDGLSYTHRKEYARWIAEAKRAETRARRLAKAIEMLRAGTKHP